MSDWRWWPQGVTTVDRPQSYDIARQLDGLELAVYRPSSAMVEEVQRFRAEAIWDVGMRPAFRGADGSFTDSRTADANSYHLVLREAVHRSIVACVAIAPLESLAESAIRTWNPALSMRLLDERGLDESAVLEAARMVVAQQWRRRGLGSLLATSVSALAQAMGRRMIWSTAGTRHNQHRLLISAGMTVREEFGRRYMPKLKDTLCVVTGNPGNAPIAQQDLLAQLRPLVEQRLEAA